MQDSNNLDYPFSIEGFHAHVYFHKEDEENYKHAKELYQKIDDFIIKTKKMAVVFGKHGWTDEPVGPHPCGQFEVVFHRKAFVDFVTWLAHQRHPSIDILIHPLSPEALPDHTTRAVWLGQSQEPNLRQQVLVEMDSLATEERLRLYANIVAEVPDRGV